jgi:DNA-binding MarR family transcriptional regulator
MVGILSSREYSIGRWISILYRYGQSYVSKKLGYLNIGSGQYVILLTLFRKDGISQEELSNHLKIDKGSIAKSINKLEDESYVKRSDDSNDKRAYKVFLTEKALAVIPVILETINSWEEMITSDLSDSEKTMVEQLLCKMAINAYSFKTAEEENNKRKKLNINELLFHVIHLEHFFQF